MVDITNIVKSVKFVEGVSSKEGHKSYRRLDIELPTIDGGTKKFSCFLKEDQKRLCGLNDTENQSRD